MLRKTLSLDGEWALRFCDAGEGEAADWPRTGIAGEGAYTAQVPGDVHLDMVRAGVIKEPLFGENAKRCEWMEEKDWWYSTTFEVPEEFIGDRVELCFEGLDTLADIWLNGQPGGQSRNALVGYTVNVTDAIRPGENLLVVRVDCGLRWAREQDLTPYQAGERPGDPREMARIFLRRAQFSVAWDWAPRLMTCGLWRSVELRSYPTLALRDVFLAAQLTGTGARISAQFEVDCFSDTETEVFLHLRLEGEHGVQKQLEATLVPGYNLLTDAFTIQNPRLWWPNGLGEPYLYDVTCDLLLDGQVADSRSFHYGIRQIELRQEPLGDEEGQSFTLIINGVPVYCKGANWVPADSIMARVRPEKYEALVEEAVEAHFNMFRVWGGGIYEDDAFWEACDRKGIMVWQDFLFACSYVPDDRPDFVAQVEREAELIIKRLRNRASLVLWCGNNENQWIFRNRIPNPGPLYGWRIYHEVLPQACAHLDPTRPYWPSSPYGGLDCNSERLGDRHAWDISLGQDDVGRVRYKDYGADRGKFISEYGFLAPPVRDALERCLPADEIAVGSPSWDFHNNTFERGVVGTALREHFGREMEELSLEDYLLLAQAFQAEAYCYTLSHFRRRKFATSGTLFWMYSDCWGATAGWTIVDYYLNRKPSFYGVQRAFAPLMVSFREEANGLSIWLVNDTLTDARGVLEYGWGIFDSPDLHVLGRERVLAGANGSQKLVHLLLLDLPEEERQRRYYWVRFLQGDRVVSQDCHFLAAWKDLSLSPVKLERSLQPLGGNAYRLTVKANCFAWGVWIDHGPEVHVDDNFFDLLPGEAHEVILRGPEEAVEGISVRALEVL